MGYLNNLTLQVLIAAALAVALALTYQSVGGEAMMVTDTIEFLKTSFIALLRMLIAPMILFSLIGGIISIGNATRLRKIGGVTVTYYLGTTGIAIALALAAVFLYHPWTAYPPVLAGFESDGVARLVDPGSDSILQVISRMAALAFVNPFDALVNLNILGIVTNAVLIGLAITLALPEDSPVINLVHHINRIIAKVLGWIIKLLPIGVFAILFDFTMRVGVTGDHGETLLIQLLSFGALVVGLTLIHGLVALPIIGWVFGGLHPIALFRKAAQPLIVAFTTSSSVVTLPVSMRAAQEELGVSESVSSFVLPLGATMNMDGTALFEAVAAIFLAYLFGVELTTIMVVTVFLMAMVSSIGAPGIPTASMAGMQIVLLAVGIPLEAIALLLVIERPLDTIRTSLNVEGDLVGSVVVQRYTG